MIRRIWPLVSATTIHNFPEGLAVGVGAEGFKTGLPLAIGIGLQNAPEGLAVAVALLGLGYSRWYVFAVAALTGMIEPVGGLLGAGIMSVSQLLLPGGSPSPRARCFTSATRSSRRRIAAGIRGGRPPDWRSRWC